MKPGDFGLDSLFRLGVIIYDPYKDYLKGNKTIKDRSGQMLDKFTKDMLKPGMLVECRSGDLEKLGYNSYYNSEVLIGEDYTCLDFSKYNNDLTFNNRYTSFNGLFDIVKIYTPGNLKDSFSFDLSRHTLIWERSEPKVELTHDQIAEKLGIKPESLVIVADGITYGNGCWTKE